MRVADFMPARVASILIFSGGSGSPQISRIRRSRETLTVYRR